MKRFGTGMLAAVFAVTVAQAALACDKDAKEAKGGCSKAAAAMTAAATPSDSVVDQGVEQVMASLPKMTYRVGALDTPCAKTAHEAAEKSGEPIQYVVAGEAYGCRQTAMNKLAEQIQSELPHLATVKHVVDGESMNCPKSAAKLASEHNSTVQHMVAGVQFDCPNHAQQVADRLAAKLASSHGCAKAFAEGCAKDGVSVAAAKSGCCSKSKGAEAKTAAAEGGEMKSGCCNKAKEAAATAAAKSGGCPHAAAAAEAKTASATEGATEVKSGCCAKSKAAAEAKTAAAEPKAEEAAQTADAGEETPQLANAKLLVREIVEFVAASRNS